MAEKKISELPLPMRLGLLFISSTWLACIVIAGFYRMIESCEPRIYESNAQQDAMLMNLAPE